MEKPLGPKKKGFVMTMAQLAESHLIKSGISKDKKQSFPTGHLRQENKWDQSWKVPKNMLLRAGVGAANHTLLH